MQCSMFPTGRNMEHCFLYARQTRLAVSSPLLSPCLYIHIQRALVYIGMDTRLEYRSPSVPAINTLPLATACPCTYRYGHKAGVQKPQCASH